MSKRYGVLFVCLGNICRSPLAKGVFVHAAEREGVIDRLRIDSCGTGAWHTGGPADPRTISVALRHGICFDHVARQIRPADLEDFDLLIPMDAKNHRDVLAMGAPPERVRLMRAFDETIGANPPPDVPDPYLGEGDGFEDVYQMIDRACRGLMKHVREHAPG